MNVPDGLLYTKEHEWVLIKGAEGKIGITDYAQSHLGDITYIELPEKGKDVKQSESFSSVESVKAASDIYAPLSGKVVRVNAKLESNPESINKSPYGDGWIAVATIKDMSERNKLMDSKKYKEYIGSIEE